MSIATALGAVGRSLRTQLLDGIDIHPNVNVTLLAPDETASNTRRINLFLYRISEHPQLRNSGSRLRPGTVDVLDAPPLSLVLSYLVTAYATNDPATGNTEAHAILGEVLRVFHQQPVIPAEALDDDLLDASEQLKVILAPLDPDDISRVWSTFDAPYRLSVAYEVSVLQLDQAPGTEQTLPARVRQIGTPQVRAPYLPPRLTGIDPPSGPVGSAVAFAGEHLAGWRATVEFSGVEAAAGLDLDADTFAVAVPAGLAAGFHQVRVDVSGLVRSTYFFEVV